MVFDSIISDPGLIAHLLKQPDVMRNCLSYVSHKTQTIADNTERELKEATESDKRTRDSIKTRRLALGSKIEDVSKKIKRCQALVETYEKEMEKLDSEAVDSRSRFEKRKQHLSEVLEKCENKQKEVRSLL